jgi:hypothetical protein
MIHRAAALADLVHPLRVASKVLSPYLNRL